MDAVLQIFKRSICPGTPFFESLAKKPPTTMDDLFRRANKYSMLEDDVRAATQQVLVAGRASRDNADRHAKPPDRPKPVDRRQDGSSRHLKQYLRSDTGGRDVSQHHNSEAPRAPVALKAVINYINGGPSDEEYDSRRSSADLVQASVIGHMGHSLAGLETPDESYPDSTDHHNILRRHYTAGSSWTSHSQRAILGGARIVTLQYHLGTHMASLHESHPFHISSNGEFLTMKGKLTCMAAS
ncbi:hypothetical protein CK203_051017 [Vitis vinifera]|uniref:Uncharacterized protein n=1 Tax=Vitis vinifera TaxID=29760 RepID=A0A438GQ14_VITVI|nr:hypothetical protein CK203_051017 [Vitis vinifera]